MKMVESKKKLKKFKPAKRFRYLPGSIDIHTNSVDLKCYNSHRYRVFNARPHVDCCPLPLNPYNLINICKLKNDLSRSELIDKQNKELLKKINMINRKGGKVDTYNPIAYRRSNKWQSHEIEMKKLVMENKDLYKLFITSKSYYQSDIFNEQWQRTLKQMMHGCRFPVVIMNKMSVDNELLSQPSISEGLEKGNIVRPLCYMEFQVKDGETIGRIEIELYHDYVPVTVQNFLEICKGTTKGGLTYRACPVHRIIKGQYLETGDITKGTGKGGASIYGPTFREENHMLRHSKAGVLSMKRLPPTVNNSQFCITFTRIEQLDHKNVVFGKVVKGNATLFKIQNYGRAIGRPYVDIIISDCGEIK
ncbi:unnamed protein product [Phaedon cochleariae]|uniref:PPIase cyclophilin-type domain-containing protein n=1 Tax=Phaedon cochleariae TaxID=80249 RepID=A0A9N9X520_PHACE|nr:unnamed protein product [Phaedon cochleariae]